MEAESSVRSQSQSKAAAPSSAWKYLSNLPSRGLFSSPVISSNLGGVRVYVCDHDTTPPEEQVIKTNTTNILIRALQINNHKGERKDAPKVLKEVNKGKRSTGRSLEERTPAKKAKNASSSCSSHQEGPSTEFSEGSLQIMNVGQLRGLLRERGLSTAGRKEDLISRLRDQA